MMKGGHGQTNQLHGIKRDTFDHAFCARHVHVAIMCVSKLSC